MQLNLVDDKPSDKSDEVLAVRLETKIRVAMHSDAGRRVAHPSAMPAGVKIIQNPDGKHFSGAGGESIE